METWTREQIEADPVMMKLLEKIINCHRLQEPIKKHLMENRHVEGFEAYWCEWAVLTGSTSALC